MGLHHTITTLDRIVQLYDERRQLLERDHEWADESVLARCAEIGRELQEKYWPQRRAEVVFAVEGPPRQIGDNRPMPNGRPSHPRLPAYGMAPLPSGGD